MLPLRAAGNINVNASISDGFFQFANYLDKVYTGKLDELCRAKSRLRAVDLGSIYLNDYTTGQLPIAPYKIGDSRQRHQPDFAGSREC